MQLARLSSATIEVPITGVPAGATVTKAYLAIKATDATPDAGALVKNVVPVAGVATFNLSAADTGSLSVRRYALSAKVILSDGRSFRLTLADNVADVQPPGIEATS